MESEKWLRRSGGMFRGGCLRETEITESLIAATRRAAAHAPGQSSASQTDAYEGVVAILDGDDRVCGLPSRSRSGTMIQIKTGARHPIKEFAQ